jgi:hypothetical protein
VADSHGTHGGLDTRTSLCRDNRKWQWMGDRVDGWEAGLADHSTISRSSVKARWRRQGGTLCALLYPFLVP